MSPEDQPPGPNAGDRPEVGSVAEEAAQLFAVLGDWAKRQGGEYAGAASGAAHAAHDAVRNVNEHLATGSEECTYCPVCQAISFVRSTSPEVKAHLLVAANSLVQAAAGILATQSPGTTAPNVEKIDLDDGDDDAGWDETP